MKSLARWIVAVVGMVALSAGRTRAAGGLHSPEWIVPAETARAVARREHKPLLVISLNGNLDGNC